MTPRLRALLPYVLVLAAAAVLSYSALHFGYTPRGDRPGPDVWPRAILALLAVACLVRIVAVLRRPTDTQPVMLHDVIADAHTIDETLELSARCLVADPQSMIVHSQFAVEGSLRCHVGAENLSQAIDGQGRQPDHV